LEEKRLKWFGHVKRLEKSVISRRASELKFEGQRSMKRRLRTRWFSQVLEGITKRGKR
jgi:hypothetical protein